MVVAARAPGRRLRVMQGFTVGASTNPYLTQILQAVPEVEQRTFSWRAAFLWRYDILHLHFPDVLFLREGRLRSIAGGGLFLLLLCRARLTRTAIVRTAHNLAPHEARSAAVTWLLRRADRWTTLWILLNPYTPLPTTAERVVIPHGDYRDWFATRPHPPSEPGTLLLFGLMRPYKGVEGLLEVFSELDDPKARLHIVGRASGALREQIEAAAQDDPRIEATIAYVEDDRLSAEIGRASVIVLPYRSMHNSGAALLALSLDRPILVPASEPNLALAAEVGEEWVQVFDPPLTVSDLALALSRAAAVSGRPDLSQRSWARVGELHAEAYARAVELAQRRPRNPEES